jgi:hypothetical protein
MIGRFAAPKIAETLRLRECGRANRWSFEAWLDRTASANAAIKVHTKRRNACPLYDRIRPNLRFWGFDKYQKSPSILAALLDDRGGHKGRAPHSVSSYTSLASMSTAAISAGSLPLLTHA